MQKCYQDLNQYDIAYDTAIHNWDEALPIGNGKMGCLLYGDGPIRFSLDRVDLWDSRPPSAHTGSGFFLSESAQACQKRERNGLAGVFAAV